MGLKKLKIDEIEATVHQTKDEHQYLFQKLKQAIKKNGQLQTIVVQKNKDGYKIVDGHIVYHALKDLRFEDVYCFVVDEDTDADMLSIEMNLVFDTDFVRMSKKIKRLLEYKTSEDVESTTYMLKQEIEKFPRVETFDFSKYHADMHNKIFLEPDGEYF